MNKEFRRAINVKAMLKRKMNKVHSKENIEKYRTQRNLVTSLKRKSLITYFDQRCTENISSKTHGQFWETVIPFLGETVKGTSNINLQENGQYITDKPKVLMF